MDHKNQMDFIKAVIQGLRDVKNGKLIELDFLKPSLGIDKLRTNGNEATDIIKFKN